MIPTKHIYKQNNFTRCSYLSRCQNMAKNFIFFDFRLILFKTVHILKLGNPMTILLSGYIPRVLYKTLKEIWIFCLSVWLVYMKFRPKFNLPRSFFTLFGYILYLKLEKKIVERLTFLSFKLGLHQIQLMPNISA